MVQALMEVLVKFQSKIEERRLFFQSKVWADFLELLSLGTMDYLNLLVKETDAQKMFRFQGAVQYGYEVMNNIKQDLLKEEEELNG